MSWLQVKNKAEGSLNGGITDVATSMVVASAAPFPAAVPFRLTIENEIVEVTVIAGATYTITRAVEDTAGAAHADLTPVYLNITASIIQQIQNVLINVGACDIVVNSSLTPKNTMSASYVKIKETKLGSVPFSTIRIYFSMLGGTLGYTYYARIYRNGTAIGTERSTGLQTLVIFSEDFDATAWAVNDLIQIYAHTSEYGYTTVVQDLKFCYGLSFITTNQDP